MNKLMISTVALAMGLGLASSAMAVNPAVDTYYFQYSPQANKPNTFAYQVTSGTGFLQQNAFNVNPTAPAGMEQTHAGDRGSFSYVIRAMSDNSVAANCTASVINGVVSGPEGSGVIPCSALPLTVKMLGNQVWAIQFNNTYPPR